MLAAVVLAASSLGASSFYPLRLDDPQAVYLAARGDGITDDTDAIQAAIDRVQETALHEGIVFVPAGRYRLTRTIHVWPGVRLIGFGAERPALLLGEHTPGYEQGPSYMVFFTGGRPRGENAGKTPPDANPGTFYSAMSNIDIEIGGGNPGAVGVRARYAQHCFMAHMDFRIGSGLAGIHDAGNFAEDVHFYGGEFGIMTKKPSPGWQFTVVDGTFEGQRQAGIQCHEAGLTLVRPRFRNVPSAIAIDPDYNEELWVKDGRFEDIPGPAVVISNENSPRTEINLENIVCRRVPVFASFRTSGRKTAGPSEIYEVRTFSHGLHFSDIGAVSAVQDVFEATKLAAFPAPVKSDIPELPARDSWVNIRSLGATGDGTTDDTEAFRKAIAEHQAIYLPSGRYRVTDALALGPDTVLIGLHPSATQIDLLDRTPAFQGIGEPKALLEAPRGGKNIVVGIGLYTNGINPRAVAAKWMAGSESMMDDVRFLGGHGTREIDPNRKGIYNNTHTADTELERRWDGQYPSLWVTGGGGGTFLGIWTPSTFAQAGMLVSDTSTEGRVYEMSSEHHVRYEVQLRNVSHWKIYSLQTEEERGEGGFALPLEIADSSDIAVANFHIYRVVSSYQPFPYAIKVTNSRDIRLRNVHCYSDSKVSFDNSVYDETHRIEERQREFAWMTISGRAPQPRPAARTKAEKLAGGFFNISGIAADRSGDVYFVDTHWQRIYKWATEAKQLATVRDNPLDAAQLVFDQAGNLLVISYAGNGTVYSFRPEAKGLDITLLKAEPAAPRPGMTPALPVNHWRLEDDFLRKVPVQKPYQFVSPDGTTFIPAGEDFVSGALYYGTKLNDVLRAFAFAKPVAGRPFYVSDESNLRTYSARLDPYGTLTDVKLFAEQGGEGIAVDAQGNVYIAAGQIFVYDPAGRQIDTIEVPERPTGLVFGGHDGRTLFITARSSLYAVRRAK